MIGAPPPSPGHTIVRTADELRQMVRFMQSIPDRGMDFETDGLRYADGKRAIGYALGGLTANGHRCWYVPVAHRTAEPMIDGQHARDAFRDALAGATSLVGHNLKFDLNIARVDDWTVPDVQVHDTLPQAHLIYEKRAFQLEKVVMSTRGVDPPWDPMEGKDLIDKFTRQQAMAHKLNWKKDAKDGTPSYLTKFGHSEVPIALEGEYSCRDVAHALMLDRAQRAEAQGIGQPWEAQRRYLYWNEMMLVRALAEMEYTGQLVHADYLRSLAAYLDEELDQRARKLGQMFRTDTSVKWWGKDSNVRDLLYGHLKMPVRKLTERGQQPSVDRGALLMMRTEDGGKYAEHLTELAEFNARLKVRSTYTISLANHVCRDGRIHASFLQQGTKSGRLSGVGPNLTNIPMRHKELARYVRQAFIVEPGWVRVYADYSQIELRFLQWITGSRNLLKAYRSPSWDHMMRECRGRPTPEWVAWYQTARQAEPVVDVHGLQAQSTFGASEGDPDWKIKRRAAKIINFGVPYGMGPGGLQGNPELMLDEATARAYFDQYHRANPEINHAKNTLFHKMLARTGTPLFTNWAGRVVHGPELRSHDSERRASAERSTFASLVQGSAAELTRISLVRLYLAHKEGRIPGVATSTVHDEIQVDCREGDLPLVAREVRTVMEDFHGICGTIPIICDLEFTRSNWADKQEYHV